MASSAMRRSLPRCGPLRRLFLSHPTSADAAASSFRRIVHSGEGEIESLAAQFEDRIFGGKGSDDRTLFQQLDKVENTRSKFGMGFGRAAFGQSGDRSNFGSGERSNSGFGDSSNFWSGDSSNFGSSFGTMDGYNSLKDGMDEKLDDAARTFQMSEEVYDEDYDFRPDVNYRLGSKYSPRDLDLTRPAAAKNPPRPQFETTTKEILKKADFRNVRFLSNFLTEAGIIIKRSQTKISAKAQRKVAREIKTSRALGLMPFTTMGKRPFIFGRTVEEDVSEEEYGYDFVEPRDAGPEDDVGGDAVPDVEAA